MFNCNIGLPKYRPQDTKRARIRAMSDEGWEIVGKPRGALTRIANLPTAIFFTWAGKPKCFVRRVDPAGLRCWVRIKQNANGTFDVTARGNYTGDKSAHCETLVEAHDKATELCNAIRQAEREEREMRD